MLVPNTPRSRLSSVFTQGNRDSPVKSPLESRDSPLYIPTGESKLLSVFITGELFWTLGSCFTDFEEHTTIFEGTSF
jgi:hypothetical protein